MTDAADKIAFFGIGIPAAAAVSYSMTDPAVVKPTYTALHAVWDAGYRLPPVLASDESTPATSPILSSSPLREEIERAIEPYANIMTLGDIAQILKALKGIGITRADILYALDRVFYEDDN